MGEPPVTATFMGGIVGPLFQESIGRIFQHTYPPVNEGSPGFGAEGGGSWQIPDDTTAVITFETPAAKVEFYAAVVHEGDGEIKVFDTDDNLLTSTTDLPLNMSIESNVPFTSFLYVAEELGAPGGIGKITYTNNETTTSAGSFFV